MSSREPARKRLTRAHDIIVSHQLREDLVQPIDDLLRHQGVCTSLLSSAAQALPRCLLLLLDNVSQASVKRFLHFPCAYDAVWAAEDVAKRAMWESGHAVEDAEDAIVAARQRFPTVKAVTCSAVLHDVEMLLHAQPHVFGPVWKASVEPFVSDWLEAMRFLGQSLAAQGAVGQPPNVFAVDASYVNTLVERSRWVLARELECVIDDGAQVVAMDTLARGSTVANYEAFYAIVQQVFLALDSAVQWRRSEQHCKEADAATEDLAAWRVVPVRCYDVESNDDNQTASPALFQLLDDTHTNTASMSLYPIVHAFALPRTSAIARMWQMLTEVHDAVQKQWLIPVRPYRAADKRRMVLRPSTQSLWTQMCRAMTVAVQQRLQLDVEPSLAPVFWEVMGAVVLDTSIDAALHLLHTWGLWSAGVARGGRQLHYQRYNVFQLWTPLSRSAMCVIGLDSDVAQSTPIVRVHQRVFRLVPFRQRHYTDLSARVLQVALMSGGVRGGL